AYLARKPEVTEGDLPHAAILRLGALSAIKAGADPGPWISLLEQQLEDPHLTDKTITVDLLSQLHQANDDPASALGVIEPYLDRFPGEPPAETRPLRERAQALRRSIQDVETFGQALEQWIA